MADNKRELQSRIRFALNQLASANQHHDFEQLAREFARIRIASNFLPATGPVARWGDQGRDFETFRSYITNSPVADATFVALVSGKKLIGACSLQRNIDAKVKQDVALIVGSGEKIDEIYYFCEADLPVGKRHALQHWAESAHQVRLEILHGQALAEQLTDRDAWWIAQQYLSIPADAFPHDLAEGDRYKTLRGRWIEGPSVPQTFADFVEIDSGLRRSLYDDGCPADMSLWLNKLRELLREECPEGMRRKVQYEIAVIALRGP